jgi:hypothetical protein
MDHLNPKKVSHLQKIYPAQWTSARKDYEKWRKDVWKLPTPLVAIALIAAICITCWAWLQKGILWQIAGWCFAAVGLYLLRTLFVRQVHWKIYSEGYGAGHVDGVNKVIGWDQEPEDPFNHSRPAGDIEEIDAQDGEKSYS